jgi:hypothetical protein
MDSNAPSVHPQQALAVYAESLVAGARVAVFGDASLGLGSRLVELGARSVQVWDPEPSRARTEADQSPRGVSVHPYAESESDTRGFDLALVIDLGQFADPAAVLRRVRRVVGIDGVAMIAARSAEVAQPEGSRAFDYYDLFDLVAPEFESVRMVAQLPFHGIALVELGEEDESPAVNVDTQLAESGRVPEAFVVVASQRGARLEPYSIVQLPSDTRGHVVNDAADLEALARAELRAELLASQLDDLRARMAEGERAADETSILEETLRVRSARVAELEKALAARGRDLADLSSEVEEMRAAAEAGRIAAAQVEEVALRADRAERRVASLESAVNSLSQEVARSGDVHSVELARVEEGLRERAQALRLLEGELARREQIVRDLVGSLEEVHIEGMPMSPEPKVEAVVTGDVPGTLERIRAVEDDNAHLRVQLDALALDLARREGEAQASTWQIVELERRLEQGVRNEAKTPAEAFSPQTNRQLAQALDELSALRAALSQEHEARARAESGEELSRARAEIERQAVLLEQLARESASRHLAGSGEFSVAAGVPSGSHEDSR